MMNQIRNQIKNQVKKYVVAFVLSNLTTILPIILVLILVMGAVVAGSQGSSDSTTGKRTRLTAQEVAQKANISVERAEDVIKILNWQLSKEKFTLEGASGSLANAEREIICFDPSIKYDTPKCLLVRKKDFLDSLDTNNLNVFWSILGEKQVFGFSIEPGEWTGRLNMSDLVYFDSGEFKSSSCYDIEENDSEE